MDINKIRDKALTEDAKMAIIADFIKSGSAGMETVTLTAPTGTLSDEDFAKISKNNCIIIASTQYFYKQYSASTVIRYGAIPRPSADHTKTIFDYVDIDKDTKAYEVKYEEVGV